MASTGLQPAARDTLVVQAQCWCLCVDCGDVREDLVLRLPGLLGLHLTKAEYFSVSASMDQHSLDNSCPAFLGHLLSTWRPYASPVTLLMLLEMWIHVHFWCAGCEDVKEELVLRLLGLLGLDLTKADCSNAFATTHPHDLDDSSSAALGPLLPAWRPHGVPDQAPSKCGSAECPNHDNFLSTSANGTAWVLPRPPFAHTPGAAEAQEQEEGRPSTHAKQGMQLPPAWYLASVDRRLFVLRQLSLGPFKESCFYAEALLDVMAASTTATAGLNSFIEVNIQIGDEDMTFDLCLLTYTDLNMYRLCICPFPLARCHSAAQTGHYDAISIP